mgnify:CR=1 FL=1
MRSCRCLPADDVEDGTVLDPLGAAIPDYSINVRSAVPEPTGPARFAALGSLGLEGTPLDGI